MVITFATKSAVTAQKSLKNKQFNDLVLLSIEGKDWWKKKLGPNGISLENCDLGLGPGVVEGVHKSMPRFFGDVGMILDLKSRLIFCMNKIQGFDKKKLLTSYELKQIVTSIAVWVAEKSLGSDFQVRTTNRQEKKYFDIGKRIFHSELVPDGLSLSNCLFDVKNYNAINYLLDYDSQYTKLFSSYPKYDQAKRDVIFVEDKISECLYEQGIANKSYHHFSINPLLVFFGASVSKSQ